MSNLNIGRFYFSLNFLWVYLSFHLPNYLARASSTMRIEMSKLNILVLFLILESIQCFTIMNDVSCGFFMILVPGWRSLFLFLVYLMFLSWKGPSFFSMLFYVPIEIIMWFLSFILLIWCATLSDFSNFKSTLHIYNKPQLVMMYNPFYMLLNRVCWYFIDYFVSIFVRDIDL